jgi:hypothetical protein
VQGLAQPVRQHQGTGRRTEFGVVVAMDEAVAPPAAAAQRRTRLAQLPSDEAS